LNYKIPGKNDFKRVEPDRPIIPKKRPQSVSFEVSSPTGFTDELILDIMMRPQKIELMDVEVRCRMARP
jgi:hypothetical protein